MFSSLRLSTAALLAAVSLVAPDAEAVTWRRGYTYTFDHRGNVIEAIAGAAQVGGVAADVVVNDNPGGDGVAVRGNYTPRIGFEPAPTFTATTRFPWSSMVGAIGRLSQIGALVSGAQALSEYFSSRGLQPTPCPQEGHAMCHGDTLWQVYTPGETYGTTVWRTAQDSSLPPYATPESACRAWAEQARARYLAEPGYTDWRFELQRVENRDLSLPSCIGLQQAVWNGSTFTNDNFRFNIYRFDEDWCYDNQGRGTVRPTNGACPSGSYRPGTWHTDVEPKLQASPPAPNNMPPIFDDILNRGGEVTSDQRGTQMSGPSSSRGPSTTTTTPQGTTTTNITYNYTYNNNRVVITQTTTTTNPDGSQSSTETDDVRPDPEVSLPQDPALPPVPDLYERRYPDGMAGVWAQKRAAFLESPLFAIIPSLTPSLGSTGCPVWTLPLGPWGTHDISIPCWVWAAIRLIFICTALFTARKLIFGG